MVWYSHLFQNFPQFIAIHTVKGFGIVNKAEIDVFLEFSCFFDDPVDAVNLISGSAAFSKTSCRRLLHCSTPLLFYPRMRKAEKKPDASCWLGGPGPSLVLWTPCIHSHVSFCILTSALSAVTNQLVLLSIRKLWALLFERGFPGGASGKEPACQCK